MKIQFISPVVVCCVLLNGLFAQAMGADVNAACTTRLEIPNYPQMAWQARVSGIVTATVTVGSGGSVADISLRVEGAGRAGQILTNAVETALRASTYKEACDGKRVTQIFHFVILENSHGVNRIVQAISFGYPNHFWITAPPILVNP